MKFFLRPTEALLDLLSQPNPPVDKVVHLLKRADVFAMQKEAQGGSHKPFSIFEMLMLRCPNPEAVDAWFARAGDLSKEQWQSPEQHPIREAVYTGVISQPGGFISSVVRRAVEAGAPVRTALLPPKAADLPAEVYWSLSWISHAGANVVIPLDSQRPFLLSQIDRELHPAYALPLVDELVRAYPEVLKSPEMATFNQDRDYVGSEWRTLFKGWEELGGVPRTPSRVIKINPR